MSVRAWANLYPWDVDGDSAAPDRLAGLGLAGVTLAAAYHAVRAVTPFHPGHRIVTRDAAVYYRADPSRWRGTALRPARLRPARARPAGSFERAAAALRARGLAVTAWAVLTHNDRLGAVVPSAAVRNAFGDPYPWALCLAAPAVREYAVTLAGDVAGLAEADAVEFEACGWYGVEHLSAHDKTAGAAAGAAAQWMLSLCFCAACRQEYAAAGADPEWLAASVRAAVDSSANGGAAGPAAGEVAARPGASAPAGAAAPAGGALPLAAADVLLRVRAALAARFQREVIAAARDAGPGKPVYLHVHPRPVGGRSQPGIRARRFGRGDRDRAVLLGPGDRPGPGLAGGGHHAARQRHRRVAAGGRRARRRRGDAARPGRRGTRGRRHGTAALPRRAGLARRPRRHRPPLLGPCLRRQPGHPAPPGQPGSEPARQAVTLWNASRATCSEVRDSAESRLTPRIRSMSRSRS